MNFKRYFDVHANAARKVVWQTAAQMATVATTDDVPRLEAVRDGNDPALALVAGLTLELMRAGFDSEAPTPDAPMPKPEKKPKKPKGGRDKKE